MKDTITPAACRLLEGDTPLVIATIVTREGCVGTIGGGFLEAKVEKKALALLEEKGTALLMPSTSPGKTPPPWI